MERYKGAIFDLDGTLVTTEYAHRRIVLEKVLGEFGKPIPSKKIINKFWFEGNRGKIITEIFGVDVNDFWESYHKYDTPELREKFTEPFFDIAVLPRIKKMGYKIGIVTSAPPEIAELEIGMIEKSTGKNLFDKVIVANAKNGFLPKPHPDGIIKCLYSLSLNNYEAIFAGNSDEDIGAAKKAWVTGVHLDRKEYDYGNLYPDWTIGSLYELEEILFNLF